jgi:hypothetical protein
LRLPARTPFKIIAASIALIVVACTLVFGSLVSLFLLLVDEPSERAGALKGFKESPAMQGFLALIFVAILVSTICRTLRSIREQGVRGTFETKPSTSA